MPATQASDLFPSWLLLLSSILIPKLSNGKLGYFSPSVPLANGP